MSELSGGVRGSRGEGRLRVGKAEGVSSGLGLRAAQPCSLRCERVGDWRVLTGNVPVERM